MEIVERRGEEALSRGSGEITSRAQKPTPGLQVSTQEKKAAQGPTTATATEPASTSPGRPYAASSDDAAATVSDFWVQQLQHSRLQTGLGRRGRSPSLSDSTTAAVLTR